MTAAAPSIHMLLSANHLRSVVSVKFVTQYKLAACAVWMLACVARANAAMPAADQAQAGVNVVVSAEMKKRHIPGMQVAVIQGGKMTMLGTYGIADIQQGTPVTTQTLFSLNSSTKSFTGVAVMQLVEKGQVKLDAPISTYLDALPAKWRQVTVAQLLTHSSGLPDVIMQSQTQGTGTMVGSGSDSSAWETVQTLPLEAPPGQRFQYNQTNYALLGKLITKLSGLPFEAFVKKYQFDVAGMSRAQFGDSRDIVPGRASSYRYQGGRIDKPDTPALEHAFDEFTPLVRPAGGVNASAGEVAQWIIALEGDRLMRASTRAAMWKPTGFTNGKSTPWAMGWPLNNREDHPVVQGIGGRRSAFFVYPKDDLAIVVLTNLAGANPEEFIDEIAGQFLPDLLAKNGGGLPRPIKLLRRELIKDGFDAAPVVYARLKKADPGFTLHEDAMNDWGGRLLQDGQLRQAVAVFKLNTELYPASANTFDSLAEGYEAMGLKPAAIANYNRSIELDVRNDHARDRLKELQAVNK